MSVYRIYKTSKANPIVLFLALGLFIFVLFLLIRGIFGLLTLIAPLMLLGALVINYRVITGYGKWLFDTLKSNPIFGVLAIVFTVLAFPFVSVFLLLKAINSRGEHKSEKKRLGEYIKYEELEEDFLDLTDVRSKKKDIEDKYNDLIE